MKNLTFFHQNMTKRQNIPLWILKQILLRARCLRSKLHCLQVWTVLLHVSAHHLTKTSKHQSYCRSQCQAQDSMTVTSLNPARSPTCQNLCRNARIQQYPCSFTTKVVQECAIIMWIATTIITNALNHHAHDWSTHWRQSLPTSCINTIILNRSEKHPAASLNISKHHRIFLGRYQDSSRSGQLPPIDHLLARTPAGKNVENDDGSWCHGDAWPEEWIYYTIHLRLVGSRRSDPATQRCTAPYLTEPKLKSEDTQRRFWIHHLLGRKNIFWLPAHQHASTPYISLYWI